MAARAIGQLLELVAGDHHRLHARRHPGWDQRQVTVFGGERRPISRNEPDRGWARTFKAPIRTLDTYRFAVAR